MAATTNRYLEGQFAPVTEEVTVHDLPITGRIPAELNGRYLRNGPNPLGLDDPAAHHWFLGEGMVHGVRLRNGKAEWYRNRWVRSASVADTLGEQHRPGPVDGMDFAPNTHVIAHAGRTLALVESGPRPYELTYDLDTVGPYDFDGTLPAGYAAHTKLDPHTGELHAIAYYWARPDAVQHVVVDAGGRVIRAQDVAVADGPMMHDFALTERYVILYDLPVTFSMEAAAAGVRLPYVWNEAHGARIGVLPRSGTAADVRWLDVEPCWVFHTLNAYDDGDRIVLDVSRHPRMFDVSRPVGTGVPTLDRWTLDLAAGKVIEERLHDRGQEFPRVDERVVSGAHRYGYTATTEDLMGLLMPDTEDMEDLDDDAFGNALLKHDLARGTVETHEFGRDAVVGEAVFAPSSPDGAEDDGYAIAFVHNPDRNATDLVILPAQDFTGDPVAAVHLPVRVPLGFHGSWVPDEDTGSGR
ncbi:MAG: carotenoid oxygenase [Streptosporangiales bacterium]|nr:carotenoid oxygenase [Streptosporangiales bacterium]